MSQLKQAPPLAVIKVGGDMVLQQNQTDALARNVKDLLNAGWQCVLLHGGGPQVNALQTLHGLKPNKIEGRRITSKADLKVVKQAVCGEVNVNLVSALLGAGVPAFGCSGASGVLIEANKRPPMTFVEHGSVDMGEVGDVVKVNRSLIRTLLGAGQVPVIASLGVSQRGQVFNINADTTVAAIAQALHAELLILSTKIGGVFRDVNDPQSLIATVTPTTAEALISDGIIVEGMIPKVQESLALLKDGVKSIVITNASKEGVFLSIANGGCIHGTRLSLV